MLSLAATQKLLSICVLALVASTSSPVGALPTGAPACHYNPAAIMKGHGPPATTLEGAKITVTPTTYTPGQTLKVVINGPAGWKGLLLYASSAGAASSGGASPIATNTTSGSTSTSSSGKASSSSTSSSSGTGYRRLQVTGGGGATGGTSGGATGGATGGTTGGATGGAGGATGGAGGATGGAGGATGGAGGATGGAGGSTGGGATGGTTGGAGGAMGGTSSGGAAGGSTTGSAPPAAGAAAGGTKNHVGKFINLPAKFRPQDPAKCSGASVKNEALSTSGASTITHSDGSTKDNTITFDWVAPSAASGPITFSAVVNMGAVQSKWMLMEAMAQPSGGAGAGGGASGASDSTGGTTGTTPSTSAATQATNTHWSVCLSVAAVAISAVCAVVL